MVQRKPWVGGNWKCNGTLCANADLVDQFNQLTLDDDDIDVVIFPSTLHIPQLKEKLAKIKVGIQNISKTGNGAFTGETSIAMVNDFGIENVLIGHSERRQYYGETDAIVADKVARAQENKEINAIICIGETLKEREDNQTEDVCKKQMTAFLKGISDWKRVVIAYEPVWAIGTGKVATPQQAQDTIKAIRDLIKSEVGQVIGDEVRIVYGGSVSDTNCDDLVGQPDIDGFLVGGASLTVKFTTIIKSCQKKYKDSKK